MSGAFAAVSGRAGRDGERRTSGAGRAFVLSASVTAGTSRSSLRLFSIHSR